MPSVYRNVALVESSDAASLVEVHASGLACFVVRRPSPSAVVVDHELLKRLGQTPRIVAE